MSSTRILFISGSIGLGHAARHRAIAGELRRPRPGVEIDWLAGDPARATHRGGRRAAAAGVGGVSGGRRGGAAGGEFALTSSATSATRPAPGCARLIGDETYEVAAPPALQDGAVAIIYTRAGRRCVPRSDMTSGRWSSARLAAPPSPSCRPAARRRFELTPLRRPFLHFPLQAHLEQNLVVAQRLARHGAGNDATNPGPPPKSCPTRSSTSWGASRRGHRSAATAPHGQQAHHRSTARSGE